MTAPGVTLAGLERYTGEQSFDLVVVNVSASVTSDPIPLPWGGTASGISLAPGLSTFLVPRGQFLASPLGQAVLLGTETAYANASATPQLLTDSGVASLLTGFGGANLSVDLSAYWQNRAIASGPGTIPGTTETGTPSSSALQVNVMAAESTLANNTGGLPSDPSLYGTIGSPPAVQAVVTLNVTSTATLDLLLAGLLDNTSGGVNGTFQSVTNQVGFLGLAPSVVAALANAVVTSEGLYGAPGYNEAPPASGGLWGDFWNAVSAVVTTIAGAVVSLVEVTWDATVAAFTYLDHLVHEALAVGGQMLARATTALESVGEAIVNALNVFLQFLYTLVKALLQPIVNAIESGIHAFDSAVGTPLSQAWNSVNTSGSVTPAETNSVGTAFGGPVFQIGLGIGVAVTIALTLLTPIDIGPSFLIGIIIGLIAGAVLSSGVVVNAAASLTSSAVFAVENLVNATLTLPATEWATLAGVIGLVGAGSEVPWSWYVMSQAFKLTGGPELAGDAAVVMAVALVALVVGMVAVVSANAILLLFAFVLASLTLAAIAVHFFTNLLALGDPAISELGWVDVGLAASAAAGSAADLGINYHKL